MDTSRKEVLLEGLHMIFKKGMKAREKRMEAAKELVDIAAIYRETADFIEGIIKEMEEVSQTGDIKTDSRNSSSDDSEQHH
jgi:hypothetical protein